MKTKVYYIYYLKSSFFVSEGLWGHQPRGRISHIPKQPCLLYTWNSSTAACTLQKVLFNWNLLSSSCLPSLMAKKTLSWHQPLTDVKEQVIWPVCTHFQAKNICQQVNNRGNYLIHRLTWKSKINMWPSSWNIIGPSVLIRLWSRAFVRIFWLFLLVFSHPGHFSFFPSASCVSLSFICFFFSRSPLSLSLSLHHQQYYSLTSIAMVSRW